MNVDIFGNKSVFFFLFYQSKDKRKTLEKNGAIT